MRKKLAVSNSVKFVILLLCGTLFFSSCENISVNSQTKPDTSPPKIPENNMEKIIKDLKDFQWEKRIILIREDENKTLQQLQDESERIDERDIIWFRLSDGKIDTNFQGNLPKDFAEHLEKDYFKKFKTNVLLIGKDGTVKSKNENLKLESYFNLIDSMPMRQSEMKQTNQE